MQLGDFSSRSYANNQIDTINWDLWQQDDDYVEVYLFDLFSASLIAGVDKQLIELNSETFLVDDLITSKQISNYNRFSSPLMCNPAIKNRLVTGIYNFLKETIKSQITTYSWSPLIIHLFLLIGSLNLVGLIPYTFTITAQLFFTLSLSLTTFICINLWYLGKNGLSSFELFLPTGTPTYIAPFLVLIEVLSYFSRIVSLSVRLFANLVAGHTLLKILSGFFLSLLFSLTGIFMGITSTLLVITIVLITGLEFLIAILQAYVFITLVLIYIHELETAH